MSRRSGRSGNDRRRRGGADANQRVVAGIHPVRELLRAGVPLRRLVVAEGRRGSAQLDEILELADRAGTRVEDGDRDTVDDLAQGLVHQGVVAVAPPYPYADLRGLLADLTGSDRAWPPLLVALDGVTDPHNVGSIARTAEAVEADALLVPARRAAGVTPTVEKAAAGALAHLPVVQEANLVRSLEACREAGLWIVGLDADGEQEIADCGLLTEPVVIVVGSEGDGLARLTAERCDAVVRLPMRGRVGSLNASVAAAVAMYEAVRQRG